MAPKKTHSERRLMCAGMSDFDAASDSDLEDDKFSAVTGKGDCPHVACSNSQGCIIQELKLLISQYDRRGTDQFRRRVILGPTFNLQIEETAFQLLREKRKSAVFNSQETPLEDVLMHL